MIFGENSRAISTLALVVEIPYLSALYGVPITPALLRLDPTWGHFARGSRFPKTLRRRAALITCNFLTKLERRNLYKLPQCQKGIK